MKFFSSLVSLALMSFVVASGQQVSTVKQTITTIAKGKTVSVKTRQVRVAKKAVVVKAAAVKPGARIVTIGNQGSGQATGTVSKATSAVTTAAGTTSAKKAHPNLFPGYPNATISSQSFGSTAVGGTSDTITLSYPYPAGVTEQNFTFGSGLNGFFGQATCNYPQPCTAPIAFQPTYPGLTINSVISTDQNGNVVYETMLYAMGTGPQFGWDEGATTILNPVTSQPGSIAVGPDGSIYLTDASENAIFQIASDFSSQTQLAITGLGTPGGIAVDGAGTLYITDKTNNVVVAYNVPNGTQSTLVTDQLSNPTGIGVDQTGAVYVADTGNNRIIEIDNLGNETTFASDLSAPLSLTIDGLGDVFYADASNGGEVTELASGDADASTFVGMNLGTLYDMAVDAAGRVYISTPGGDTLISPDGTIQEYGGGPNYGMALDQAGDVFFSQPAQGSLLVNNRSVSNFILSTMVDTTTTGGDTISNTGNTNLTLSNIAISGGTVFTDDPNDQCVAGLALAPASRCNTLVDFTPTAAQNYTEMYTVTSDSLNAAGATNGDTLYGDGVGATTATALTVSPNPATSGQAVTFTATVTLPEESEYAAPSGAVNFLDGTTILSTMNLPISGNTVTFSTSALAAGTHSITAMYAGDTYNDPSTSAVQTLQVGSGSGTPLTSNLLQNPGAELGSLMYWTIGGPGTPTVDSGTFDAGINPHTGSYDFLGHDSASDSLSQTVSILQQGITAAQIDGGTLFAQISFWEQGLNQGTPSDDGFVALTFLDTNNTTISTETSATIDSDNGTWTNATGLYAIPSGTRSITYTMNFVRNQQIDLDAFIDDNSLEIAMSANVGTIASTTTLSSYPSPATAGQTVTFSIAVSGPGQGAAVPTGTVTLTNTGVTPATILGTVTLDGTGSATYKTTTLPVGTASIVATYSGDANYASSMSAADTFTVSPQQGTVTTLTATPATVAYRTPITLSAKVSGGDSIVTSGQVYFCDAAAPRCNILANLGVAQLTTNNNGAAVLKLAAGTIGTHNFTATFVQTSGFASSTSAAQAVSVTGTYPTTTAIAATGTAGSYGLIGTVVGFGANPAGPTGTVSFLDTSNANASLGSGVLGDPVAAFSLGQAAASPITVGGTPHAVATGDFNGDGFQDAVVANTVGDTVSVLLGKGDGTFQPQVTYQVGAGPDAVQVADLNHDGFPDLIVGNGSDVTIGVLLGKGDGTFQAPVTYAVSNEPLGLSVMDINHDGYPDVVEVDGEQMLVLLGNGDGTLQPAVAYVTGADPSSIAEGDFNGDGNVDVVVGNLNGATVGIFLGNGDGTFQPMVTYATESEPSPVQIGDLNGDGILDLVVANSNTSTLSVLLGKGDGTFQTQVIYQVGPEPSGLAIADLNGDGIEDITTANAGSMTQSVLLGNGDGTFQNQVTFPTGNTPYSVATADLNGDGLQDLVVTNLSDNTATIFLSQVTETAATPTTNVTVGGAANSTHNVDASYPGDANFGASLSATTPLAGGGATQAATTTMLTSTPAAPTVGQAVTFAVTVSPPVGNDGIPTGNVTLMNTAVTPATTLGTITLDGGTGTFSTSTLAAGTYTVTGVYSGDTSYATSTSGVDTFTVAPAAPGATTTTLAVTPTTGAQGTVFTLTATVVDGGESPVFGGGVVNFLDNGKIVASVGLVSTDSEAAGTATFKTRSFSIGSHALTAMYAGTNANAASTTATAVTINVTGKYATTTALTSTGTQGSYALTATVDGSGFGPTGNVVFTDSSTNATLGTVPVSSVTQNFVAGAPIAVGGAPTQVVPADLNGDGKLDLVVANGSGTMVTVLIGNGDGTYTAMPSFGTNYSGITGICVGDFNGDGKLDIATANGSTVGIFLGNGDGTFGAEQDFANTGASQGVFAADVNADGKLDLVVTDNNSGITIMIGNGDGTFAQPNGTLATGGGPNFSLAVADFNGDGKLDIAFGNKYDNTLSVLLGNGDGTFQPEMVTTAGSSPRSAASGDFNGDGKPDVVLFNAGGTVSVLLGNGDGTFQAEETYAIGANAFGGSVGDLNGDGKLDLVAANQDDGTVSVLIGNGDGTFQTQQVLTSGSGTDFAVIGDANGDGVPDIEAVNAGGNTTTVFLNQSQAAISLTGVTLPGMGMDNVVATYSGDTAFTGSTSNTLTLPSNQVVASTTTLTVTPLASTVGQAITFTANVSPASGGGGIPTGDVTLMNTAVTPATVLGTITLDGGTGTFSTSTLAAGTYSVTAIYSGDTSFATSTSSAVTFTVSAPTVAVTTTTTLTVSAATVAYEKPTTLTANVTFSTGAPVSAGQVFFCDAAAAQCSLSINLGLVQLNAQGNAVLGLSPGTIGAHKFLAKFAGTGAALTSASADSTVTVTGTYPTTTAISTTGSAGIYGLTGTVVGLGDIVAGPTGTVTFEDAAGGTALGTAALGASALGLGFAQVTSATTINYPGLHAAVGDFNGDGIPDVAYANDAPYPTDTTNANTVTIALGNGDGTFTTVAAHPATGTSPNEIMAGDFNGDGKLDLATVNANSNNVTILLGNGDGTFTAAASPAAGTNPVGIVAGDFNGDGIEDLAVSSINGTLTILLGNGDGTFTASTLTLNGYLCTMAVGDFNGDGKMDIAITNAHPTSELEILLGNGDGTFTVGTPIAEGLGSNLNGVTAGDLNGDGKTDLVVSNQQDNTVTALLSNGDGTFTQMPVASATDNGPIDVQVADFNADGFADIAVSGNSGVQVLPGNGDGTFTAAAVATGSSVYYGIAVGDFNGDGIPDIVSTDATANVVDILTQITQTATTPATSVTLGGGSDSTHNVVASYPGDTNFSASISQPAVLTGGQFTTSTTLAIAPTTASVGQSVTFSVAVTEGALVTPVPTGTVTLMNIATAPATVLGTITLGTTGAGSFSTTTLAAATYNVAAVYSGDANYLTSTSAAQSFTVSAAPAPTVASITPAGAVAGSAATTITLTGTNFAATDVVKAGATTLTTAYVNATTLTAIMPANLLAAAATLPISVTDTASTETSGAVNFVVSTAPAVVFTGPSTASSDQQPMVTFQLTQPYAVPINCLLTLTFAPSTSTGIVDPALQFSSGGTTLAFTIPAGSTATPPVQFQTGTVAGTVTVTLTIVTADGVNVTPASVAPVVVTLPETVPEISTATVARTGAGVASALTVTMQGFSNTREVKTAIFHFTPTPGNTLTTTDLTVDVSGIFEAWFGSDASTPYGSTFTYTQPFNLNADPATIQSVTVTLVNGVGDSVVQTAQ